MRFVNKSYYQLYNYKKLLSIFNKKYLYVKTIKYLLRELKLEQIVIKLHLMFYHLHLPMISLILIHHQSLFIQVRSQFFSNSRK